MRKYKNPIRVHNLHEHKIEVFRKGSVNIVHINGVAGASTKIYRVWKGMKERCYNKKNQNYKWYGGRGITVCKEWQESFESFAVWALSRKYIEGESSIERIDNDKGYCPENCTLLHKNLQQKHTRSIRFFGGKNFSEISKELGGHDSLVEKRLKRGWGIEEAVKTKSRTLYKKWHVYNGETASDAAKRLGLSPNSIRNRINNLGWSLEEAFTIPKDGKQNGRDDLGRYKKKGT